MDLGADFYAAKARLILDLFPTSESGRVRRGVLQRITRATNGIVSGAYLYQLSKGKIANPTAEKLKALAEGLGFPVDWWWLPVEAGPPPQQDSAQAIMTRLAALPPQRQEEAVERLLEVLKEIEAEDI